MSGASSSSRRPWRRAGRSASRSSCCRAGSRPRRSSPPSVGALRLALGLAAHLGLLLRALLGEELGERRVLLHLLEREPRDDAAAVIAAIARDLLAADQDLGHQLAGEVILGRADR